MHTHIHNISHACVQAYKTHSFQHKTVEKNNHLQMSSDKLY